MNVHWTDGASADLRAIHEYLSSYSVERADEFVERIVLRSRQIGEFPLSGSIVGAFQLGQIRELFEHKYRIVYYVNPDEIQILGVLHASRDVLRD